MNETFAATIGVAIVAVIINLIFIFVLFRILRAPKKDAAEDQSFVLIQQQMQELNRTLDSKLAESQRSLSESSRAINESVHQQHSEVTRINRELTEKLVQLGETNRQVVSFTDQLQSLQDLLKNPKHRGILGEYFLETVLKNALPPGSYQMQYRFDDGEIVDAVVFIKDKIVPIDSKFSLENYNRISQEKNEQERARLEKLFINDLKLRVKETSKYIRPKEGTTEFAFMFIPHEAIFYDLLVNKIGDGDENVLQRAMSEYKVLITSPTSFSAYLQTVLQGLRALQIEEHAKQIIKNVTELSKHWLKYEEHMHKLGSHLTTTVNSYNIAHKELGKVDKDVLRITGEKTGIDPLLIEKPVRGEEE